MVPWLVAFGIFTILKLMAFLFFSIVNDLIFAYNSLMVFLWTIFLAISIYGWIVVYSLYIELTDLTKLEDLAHLRVTIDFVSINIVLILKFLSCYIKVNN